MNEVNVFLGAWMLISPWVLGLVHTHNAAARVAWLIGAALILFGVGAAEKSDLTQQSTTLALGLLLLIAPWAASFSADWVATLNSGFIGVFAVVVALHAMHRDAEIYDRLDDLHERFREQLRGRIRQLSRVGHSRDSQ